MKAGGFLERVVFKVLSVCFIAKAIALILFHAVTGRGGETADRHLRSML